jgi:hypothetical protein
MLLEKMSKEMVLVALDVDKSGNLSSLEASRRLFARLLGGLRDGDAQLALPKTTDPKVLDSLTSVGGLWPMFGDIVRAGIENRQVPRSSIDNLVEVYAPLLKATERVAKNIADGAPEAELRSLLTVAIDLSSRQRTLSQQMAKEYFLIAYGYEERKNRRSLKKSYKLFDRNLQALVKGDSQQKVMPPPPAVATQLRKAALIWDELSPLIFDAVKGAKPGRDAIATVARSNLTLLDELQAAVLLYQAL